MSARRREHDAKLGQPEGAVQPRLLREVRPEPAPVLLVPVHAKPGARPAQRRQQEEDLLAQQGQDVLEELGVRVRRSLWLGSGVLWWWLVASILLLLLEQLDRLIQERIRVLRLRRSGRESALLLLLLKRHQQGLL